jgi:uncharacterized membrane protein (UPF0127 family)
MLVRGGSRWSAQRVAFSLLIPLAIAGCAGASTSNTSTSRRSSDANSSGGGRVSDAARKYPLDSLPTDKLSINGHVFRVWLARDFDARRPGVVEEGLMHVPSEEIADDQGMLFVFSDESVRSFWMRNTIAPLDIAFARANGTVVKIWPMPPLTLQTFSSLEPAMFALEVKQGTFQPLGINEGDQIEIPDTVFTVE